MENDRRRNEPKNKSREWKRKQETKKKRNERDKRKRRRKRKTRARREIDLGKSLSQSAMTSEYDTTRISVSTFVYKQDISLRPCPSISPHPVLLLFFSLLFSLSLSLSLFRKNLIQVFVLSRVYSTGHLHPTYPTLCQKKSKS